MAIDPHRRVLVVDDDPSVRGLLSTVLRANDLTVDEAADGLEALRLMAVHQYAVILLDLIMPRLDGFGVIEALGISDGWQPVVLVVTGADRAALERLDPRRIHGIVRKPFEPQELASVVVACAEIRGRSAFGTMAIAAIVAGSPFLALLKSSWS